MSGLWVLRVWVRLGKTASEGITRMNSRAQRFALITGLVVLLFGASHAALSWSGTDIAAITATPSAEGIPFIPIPTRDAAVPIDDYLAQVFTPNIVYMPGFGHLEVHNTPDGDVIGQLGSYIHPVLLTGESEIIDGETWVSILYDDPPTPEDYGDVWPFGDVFVLNIEGQYAGWVRRIQLVANMPRAVFCADPRIAPLMDDLRAALRDEDAEALAEIVSPRGLYMSFHNGSIIFLTPDEVSGIFVDDSERNWGNNGYRQNDLISSLAEGVIPRLKEDLQSEDRIVMCNDNQDGLSDNTVLYALRIDGYEGMHNFYAVMHPGAPGFEMDWSAWGLAFEYWDDEPRILGFGHYRWTP